METMTIFGDQGPGATQASFRNATGYPPNVGVLVTLAPSPAATVVVTDPYHPHRCQSHHSCQPYTFQIGGESNGGYLQSDIMNKLALSVKTT